MGNEEQLSKVCATFKRLRYKLNSVTAVRYNSSIAYTKSYIPAAFENYYEDLYGNRETLSRVPNEVLASLPKIPEAVKEITKAPIMSREIQRVIKEFPTNKSPGPDPIGAKVYKTFADTIGNYLVGVYEDIKNRKLLPPSMQKRQVVLIPEKSY